MMNIDQHHQLQQQHQQQMLQQQAQAQAQAQQQQAAAAAAAANAAATTSSPRQVSFNVSDHYQILEIVGEGAYGIVCSAIHKPSQQKLPLKN